MLQMLAGGKCLSPAGEVAEAAVNVHTLRDRFAWPLRRSQRGSETSSTSLMMGSPRMSSSQCLAHLLNWPTLTPAYMWRRVGLERLC